MLVEDHRIDLIDGRGDFAEIRTVDVRGHRIGDGLPERRQHGAQLAREGHRQLVKVREILRRLEVDEYALQPVRAHDFGELGDCARPRDRTRKQGAHVRRAEVLRGRAEVAHHEQQPRPFVAGLLKHARHRSLSIERVDAQRIAPAVDECPFEHDQIELFQIRVERRVRVVVPIDVEAADQWRAGRRVLLAIRRDGRNAIHVTRLRHALRRRQRLLKAAAREQPRALREPNDWLSRQRLWMQRRNVGREQQTQTEGEPDGRRQHAEDDGGATDALPSPARLINEDWGPLRHGEKRMIYERTGE